MQSRKYYCSRCQKSFPSFPAKRQHMKDSPTHNVCHVCSSPPDYPTEEDLDEHLEQEHNICTSCERRFDTPSQLAQHDRAMHNMCMTCRQYFNTAANLKSVCAFIFHLDKWRLLMTYFPAYDHSCSKDHRLPRMFTSVCHELCDDTAP